jgi:hypothetical protein
MKTWVRKETKSTDKQKEKLKNKSDVAMQFSFY